MDKIIEASYDEKTGISKVTLGTHWGIFTHTVSVKEEDFDVANKWDGCKFAHYLCMIDKLNAKGRAFIERSKGVNHTATVIARAMYADGISRIQNQKEFNKTLNMMRDQAYYLNRDGHKYLDVAKTMKKDYSNFVEETLATRRSFKKKGE